MPMESTKSKEIEDQIKALRKNLDRELIKQYKSLVGEVFHVKGMDFFILVTEVKGRDILTLEIQNGDMINVSRKYNDMIFLNPEFKSTKEKFRERLDLLHKDILTKLGE